MNTKVKDLMERFYLKALHRNLSNGDIDSAELLVYLNEATREVHRWCSLFRRSAITKTMTLEMLSGVTVYLLPEPIADIVSVVHMGKPVFQVGPTTPAFYRQYELLGFDRLRFVNIKPHTGDRVEVTYVPASYLTLVDSAEATNVSSETSLFPPMFDDLLIEWCFISWQLRNDMITDEEAVKNRWFAQITAVAGAAAPIAQVGEYYQAHQSQGDMKGGWRGSDYGQGV